MLLASPPAVYSCSGAMRVEGKGQMASWSKVIKDWLQRRRLRRGPAIWPSCRATLRDEERAKISFEDYLARWPRCRKAQTPALWEAEQIMLNLSQRNSTWRTSSGSDV